MKVLVSGGTGVVGRSTVNALLREGHTVRLLSRHAADDATQWASGVEAFPGNVSDADSIRGAADGCDAIVHIAGIVHEEPPHATFESVNVEGTRNLIAEADRAGVRRFVHLSSLGADRGRSAYHESKRRSEEIVAGFAGSWTILRPGNVYGPGDDVISLLLRMVRTLPVVPQVGSGDHLFQPIWHEDLAFAIADAVTRNDLDGDVLELAGSDTTSVSEILDHFARITDRSPARLPVPEFVARAATGVADALGVPTPVNADQVTMLVEENCIQGGGDNALISVFGITPTPLEDGLVRLADEQPEQTPAEGVGKLKRRLFWIDIEGAKRSASELFADFCARFGDFVPIETAVEPGTPQALTVGGTLTLALPARGNIQVRVEEVRDNHATVATLAGHPLAGAVSFAFEERGAQLRFTIEVLDRPASRLDQIALALGASVIQSRAWMETCQRVAEASGGRSPAGPQHEDVALDGPNAAIAEERVNRMIKRRKRTQENVS
jgi:uncharacterized protein YbjT (DUF2867 family)